MPLCFRMLCIHWKLSYFTSFELFTDLHYIACWHNYLQRLILIIRFLHTLWNKLLRACIRTLIGYPFPFSLTSISKQNFTKESKNIHITLPKQFCKINTVVTFYNTWSIIALTISAEINSMQIDYLIFAFDVMPCLWWLN